MARLGPVESVTALQHRWSITMQLGLLVVPQTKGLADLQRQHQLQGILKVEYNLTDPELVQLERQLKTTN